jgi:hypothetical protein
MLQSQDKAKTHNLNGMLRLGLPIVSAVSGFPVSLFSGFLQKFLIWEGFRLKSGFSIELSRPRYNVRRFYLFVDPPYDRLSQFLLHPVSSGVLELTRVPPQSSAPRRRRRRPRTCPTSTGKHSSTPATGTQPAPASASSPLAGVLLAPASAHSYSYVPWRSSTNRPPHPHPKRDFCALPIFTRLTLRSVPGVAVSIRPHPPRRTRHLHRRG